MLNDIVNDLRHAWRGLLGQPGFALLAVLVLVIGIGANTAIFTIAHAVVLRPLSYPEPERLVIAWPERTINKMIADALVARRETFAAVSPTSGWAFSVTGGGDPEMIAGAKVGSAHFDVLGARPLLGRTFRPEDATPDARVAILSHGLWQRRFGGDPQLVGRTIDVDGQAHTVVGVMGADFRPLESRFRMWLPLPIDATDEEDYQGSFYLRGIARLQPGVSAAQADQALAAVTAALRAEHPNLINDDLVAGARTMPLHRYLVGDVRPALLLLLATAGMVLLVACANVANLVLTRAVGRQRELAVRTALGAGRWRLIQQLLTEGLLLGTLGAVGGLLAASWGVEALLRTLPSEIPRAAEIGIDTVVLAFAAALALLTALASSAAPALRAVKADVQKALKAEATASTAGRSSGRLSRTLAALQVAGATVLLIGAGLLLESLWQLQATDPGFRPEGLITMRLDPPAAHYPEGADKAAYYERLLERLRSMPGIEAAGAIHLLPLTSDNWSFPYLAEDHPVPPGTPAGTPLPVANFRIVTPGYFQTAGIALIAGRHLSAADHADAPPTGMINRTMADQLWPEGDAVGKTIRLFGDGGPSFTVVGVVDDVRQHQLGRAPFPELYRPHSQWPMWSAYVMVRSPLPMSSLVRPLRDAVWSIDDQVPITDLQQASAVVHGSVAGPRFVSNLIALFAAFAALLGMVGIYGVISVTVAQRSRELAIRIALGERGREVVARVLRQGLQLAAAGVLLGVASAAALARILDNRLYGVTSIDLETFVVVALLIVAAALASCVLPAWRASRTDPAIALRNG